MITEPHPDEPEYQHECEGCGRSVIGRFGHFVQAECPSCEADFKRYSELFEIEADPLPECSRCNGVGTLKPKFPRLLPVKCPKCNGLGTVEA